MDTAGMSCVKYLLFFFNLLFAISGIVILTVGIIIQKIYSSSYSSVIADGYFSAPVVLIGIGAIVFIVAFFGCCGAIQESNFMLITFAVLLLLTLTMEVAAGVAGYLFQKDVDDFFKSHMEDSMLQYNKNSEICETWKVLQHDFECCGTVSVNDWAQVFPNGTIPHQCCPDLPVDGTTVCTAELAYSTGCLQKIKDKLDNYNSVVGGVVIGVAFCQLFGVIIACCLVRSIRKEYETV